jgi:hypothetical protein
MPDEIPVPRCGNCAYRVEQMLPLPDIGRQLVCHLMPPTPVLLMGQGPNGQIAQQLASARAVVTENMHCFQWAAKLDS